MKAIETPFAGFRGQATYTVGTNRLPVQVVGKGKFSNNCSKLFGHVYLDCIQFILKCPTLSAVKVIMTPYLLLI